MTDVVDAYPLTPSQLGILVDTQRDPDPELYFEQVRFDLVGPVDPDRLRDAWCRTIEHQPALRTGWLWEGLDQPVQVVRDQVELPWTVVDRSGEPRSVLDELAAEDRRRGFDLRRPPVMRITVVRLGADRLHVIWSFHHIVLDGWSAALVLDEVLARHAGRTVAASPPFKDHIAWIARQDAAAAERHWRRLLAGFDQPNVIAGTGPDDGGPFRLAREMLRLDEPEATGIAAVAREHRVTVNTLVQAAWAVTVSCYSGDADVVFGVTGSGRPAEVPGVESIVGMFLATLPMRVRLDPGQTVADLWRAVQLQQLDLTQYQYSALAEVLRASDVPAGRALFDSALIFENFPRPDDAADDIVVEHHEVFEQTRFPLTLMVGLDGDLELLALFDEHRLDRGRVSDLLDGFRRVLRAMVGDPTVAAASITPLDDSERRRLIVEVNETDHPFVDSTVHDEIASCADRVPDRTAIVDGDRTVTYRELVDLAGQAAKQLRASGVEAGGVVLVACRRSADAVVAALGAMTAGAAYLAVGPESPDVRLRAIVEDAAPAVVVTSASATDRFDAFGVPVVDVAALTRGHEHDDATPTAVRAAPDDTMFVVFTSGSTGRPKGVPGTHRAVLNRCAWEQDVAPFGPDEVACQKTTFEFVDHVAELWGPLVIGRTVLIVGDEVVRDPHALVDTWSRHRIRRIVLVPSLLELLLDAISDLGRRVPDLRRWTLSGERLPTALAARFHAAMPEAQLVNVYGMSEIMADATAFEATAESAAASGTTTVPIGRPIRNQRVYVLDDLDRPTPVGVPGQIWVSGVGLMRGYWRRDDLTDEQIVVNALGEGVHARRYATGDIGRWTADTQLEYVGRRDRQVKVRGQRVELGDVEAVLERLPGVREAVVVDVSSDDRPTSLVGYVVADDGAVVDPGEIRRGADASAPSALVPEQIVLLDAIPLLPSGKVDHRALATRRPPLPTTTTIEIPDDDPVVSMLAIWRDVLGNERIGPDDDFFDAGGHSLAGMRVLARITREYDVNLALSVLFSAPTPRRLLACVVDAQAGGAIDEPAHLVPISRGSDERRVLYCVHGAGGNVLNFRDLATALAPDWGLTGIQASGVDGMSPPHGSMSEMCEAYIADVLADRGDRPVFLAGFSGGGVVAYEMAARLAEMGRDVGAVVLLDTFHPTFRARRRTVGEHASAFARQGPSYLAERIRVRRQRRLYEHADEMVDEPVPGVPIPHELRDAVLVNNNLSIFGRDEARRYDGEVWMYAATDVLDVLDHAGPDRGWAPYASQLRCRAVPGGHHDFVLHPHAAQLADMLRDDLDRAFNRVSS